MDRLSEADDADLDSHRADGLRLRRLLLHPWVVALVICHGVFAGMIAARYAGALQPLELLAYDLARRVLADRVSDDTSRVVVIAIEEEDLRRHGWPLSDGLLAEIGAGARAAGAEAVLMDIVRDWPVAPGSDQLDALLRQDDHIYWAYSPPDAGWIGTPPPEPLIGTDRIGFADMIADPDGITRRGLVFLAAANAQGFSRSLGLVGALAYLRPRGIAPQADTRGPEYMRLGETTLRPMRPTEGAYVSVDAGGYQFVLDFANGITSFAQYSLQSLLDGDLPEGALAGRIVFVGAATESVKDHFYTPFGAGRGSRDVTHGVQLHANVADQILRHALDGAVPIRGIDDRAELAIAWGAALLMGALALTLSIGGLGGVVASGLAAMVGVWLMLLSQGLWLPVVEPAAVWLLSGSFVVAYRSQHDRAARTLLMRMLSAHVSDAVAREIWRQRSSFLDGGRPRPRRLVATVLFSDIDGFTPLSESLSPPQLMAWLNTYMEAMARAVARNGGVVDKFIGDAVMAIFGVPVPRQSAAEIDADARKALACALAMRDALVALNAEWRRQGLPQAAFSVGIHTGPVIAGSLGGPERMDYTVIGDTVNTAARLDSFAKTVPAPSDAGACCRIVVSAETWKRLGGTFDGLWVGEVALKGKTERIGVYRLTVEGNSGGKTSPAAD